MLCLSPLSLTNLKTGNAIYPFKTRWKQPLTENYGEDLSLFAFENHLPQSVFTFGTVVLINLQCYTTLYSYMCQLFIFNCNYSRFWVTFCVIYWIGCWPLILNFRRYGKYLCFLSFTTQKDYRLVYEKCSALLVVCSHSLPRLENMTIQQLRKESHPIQKILENVSEWFRWNEVWQRQTPSLQPARFSEERQKQTYILNSLFLKTVVQWERQ